LPVDSVPEAFAIAVFLRKIKALDGSKFIAALEVFSDS